MVAILLATARAMNRALFLINDITFIAIHGWSWLNCDALLPLAGVAAALVWLGMRRQP
ncbi:MAG: hypothetical protein LBQ32_05050 [Burkholderiaceae bacterium]|jgi:hypothetical protein|nr:hypothetical protein [Burkholderiaceae bacterium]